MEATPHGFKDLMLYEVQIDDPTKDEMMVFVKGKIGDFVGHNDESSSKSPDRTEKEGNTGGISNSIHMAILELGRSLLDEVINGVGKFRSLIYDFTANKSTGQRFAASQFVEGQLVPIFNLLIGLKDFAGNVNIKNVDTNDDYIPREIFLLLNALIQKANRGNTDF